MAETSFYNYLISGLGIKAIKFSEVPSESWRVKVSVSKEMTIQISSDPYTLVDHLPTQSFKMT